MMPMPERRKLLPRVLIAALAAMALSAMAADTEENIEYSSDGGGSIEIIDGLRVTTVRGNVHIRQGESQLWGDTARIEQDPDSGLILRVVVDGSPARFERRPSPGAEIIHGTSDRVLYFSEQLNDISRTVVEFIGTARFTSGRTELQCAEIKHFLESGTTESTGPCSGVLAPRGD